MWLNPKTISDNCKDVKQLAKLCHPTTISFNESSYVHLVVNGRGQFIGHQKEVLQEHPSFQWRCSRGRCHPKGWGICPHVQPKVLNGGSGSASTRDLHHLTTQINSIQITPHRIQWLTTLNSIKIRWPDNNDLHSRNSALLFFWPSCSSTVHIGTHPTYVLSTNIQDQSNQVNYLKIGLFLIINKMMKHVDTAHALAHQ